MIDVNSILAIKQLLDTGTAIKDIDENNKMMLQTSGVCAACLEPLSYMEISTIAPFDIFIVDEKSHDLIPFTIKTCKECYKDLLNYEVDMKFMTTEDVGDYYE